MKVYRAFGDWANRGPFTPLDLGIYRIICAIVLLAVPWRFRWIDELPSSLYVPPPGPFQLVSRLPPHGLLGVLEVVLVVATVLMGVGLATRWMSLLVTVLLITGLGFSFSFGKIDHSIILVLVPAVLSFANWGSRLSLDAVLRRSKPATISHWPLRLLGVLISVSFGTAVIAKVSTGWLSPDSQVVKGYFLRTFYTESHPNVIAQFAASIQAPALWELLDWSVVAIELFVAISFVSWRLMRISFALATLFHLGVFLLLGIKFYWNVVAYGAVVSWSKVPVPKVLRKAKVGVAVVVVLLLLGTAGLALAILVGDTNFSSIPGAIDVVFWGGATIGAGYLLWTVIWLVKLRRGTASPSHFDSRQLPRWAVPTLAVVIILLVASLPTEFIFKKHVAEPYPALFQPDFNGPGPLVDARVYSTAPKITIDFTNGSSQQTSSGHIIPVISSSDTVFKAAFWERKTSSNPETEAWLKTRLDSLYAPLRAKSLTVQWIETKYDHISGEVKFTKVVHTTVINLLTGRVSTPEP